ncbi:LysR family transcriptional regulator [Roseicyclus sp. F158]|uniref:LysR family transcriptional regulator n=1 Tax=Tropicimonas omnivorans TaxID=3075590 RepID=A0ABU3DH72_9RHOB|nr:LysR family transcriptional regulator [Roseicyclus sp. F158]MDT0683058.1 LysR family transcriptional regulator [Roseicyclus sp. F158]
MPVPDPRSLDFAALETLRLVHTLGSFTAAAEVLDVNQSAVSYTIAKLRSCFGDPLFVREGGRQVPTERCEGLIAHAQGMLDTLDDMVEPDTFDPANSEHTVTLACNFYERILLIPKIVAALRAQAPRLRINVINSLGDGHLRLLRREADLLIGPFGRAESGFHSRRLHEERYACLMDPGHPAAGKPLDEAAYLSLNHILIDYNGTWKSAYLKEIEAAGHTLRPAITAPSPAGIARMVAASDLVATVPRRMGEAISDGLAIRESPFPGTFDISVVWTARVNASARHAWLRERVFAACR